VGQYLSLGFRRRQANLENIGKGWERNEKAESTGFRLALVKKIVKTWGGGVRWNQRLAIRVFQMLPQFLW
jgi:signal transduction histidine kinase